MPRTPNPLKLLNGTDRRSTGPSNTAPMRARSRISLKRMEAET